MDEVWIVKVRAEGQGPPGEVRLRRLLKSMLRAFGLRCVDIKPGESRPAEKKQEPKWFPML